MPPPKPERSPKEANVRLIEDQMIAELFPEERSLESSELLDRIRHLTEVIEASGNLRIMAVEFARDHSVSWAQIGEASGLSGQAAQDRWRSLRGPH